jgi:predicted TIM-barrel enzyme
VLIGGRTDAGSIGRALDGSDGVIVGSCLRRHGDTAEPIDPARLDRFMAAVHAARGLPAAGDQPAGATA